ncbi:MAG: hypothetical protein GXO35_09025, partial [Gammaproteobacteria bacterium]|nr:hypothetical protein [Gammaproteobacteria bacterium]
MNINKLLFFGFSIIILFVTSAAYLTYQMTQNSILEFNHSIHQQYKKHNLVLEMQLPARSYTMHMQQAILTDDPFDRDQIIMQGHGFASQYNLVRADFMLIMNDYDKKWLEGLDDITDQISEASKKVLRLQDTGHKQEAIRLLRAVVFPLTEVFSAHVSSYAIKLEGVLAKKLLDEEEQLNALVLKISVMTALVVLLSLFIVFYITRKIQLMTKELCSLNASLENRVNERTNDLQQVQEELIKQNDKLREVSIKDALTGVYNRFGLREKL